MITKDNCRKSAKRQSFVGFCQRYRCQAVGFILMFVGIGRCFGASPGEPVDLARFGHVSAWDGEPGIEWDEPREIQRVDVEFKTANDVPVDDSLRVEYWVSSWPPKPAGGWTATDSPWQGEWRTVIARREKAGKSVSFRFAALSNSENPNAQNIPGPRPFFRRTLKIRLHFSRDHDSHVAMRIYGRSYWSRREVNIQSGCEGTNPVAIKMAAYNGVVLQSKPLRSNPPGIRVQILYTEHPPTFDQTHRTEYDPISNDRTVLSIRAGEHAFAVSVDDLIERKAVYVKPFGIFLGDAADGELFSSYKESGSFRPGEDIFSRTSRHPEETLAQSTSEIPALHLAGRPEYHPFRYMPLGFAGSREKYCLDFNGNVFLNKRSLKALKGDLEHMLWEGDEIYYRLGTGLVPDFREREASARQSIPEGDLPLVTTNWQTDAVDYEEQAYATMLDGPLDDTRLRGDEPSVLLLKLTARNQNPESTRVSVWFHVSPSEHTELENGLLLADGNHTKLLRAVFKAANGEMRITDLPVGANRTGRAVLWSLLLAPRSEQVLYITIPFRTATTPLDWERFQHIQFSSRFAETMEFWRRVRSSGMQIKVPDEDINRLYRGWRQHVLVTFYRDISSQYDMLPAGTLDYNVFPTETCMQVRLLEMQGLHDLAWRFLRPIVELQGTHPFPGLYRDTSGVFHGTRVDPEHDYTMGGYNFSHGWVLWQMAAHYFFTRDEQWLRGVLPRILKAEAWIIEERKATMRKDTDGTPVPEYGLLPPGVMEDNQEWQFWFGVNAYTYWGMNAAAEAVSAIDTPEGARLKKEAAAYREDIRNAVLRAMAQAPVVPVRDGTFIPYVPPRLYLRSRDLGWIRNVLHGAHDLIDCGVFNPDEPIARWIAQDYEENLYMADDSLSVPDRDWFNRGGVASLEPAQVFTPIAYLERDEVPQALRTMFSTFAASYYPDVNEFTEWISRLGTSGGPFFKTSDEAAWLTMLRFALVRESGNRLYLNSGAPKDWFLPGKTIEVDRAATFFGEMSFHVESHSEQGYIRAWVSPPHRNEPLEVLLRLRDPDGKKIIRVELNGHIWLHFDSEHGTITIPKQLNQVDLRAYFQ